MKSPWLPALPSQLASQLAVGIINFLNYPHTK
jgi:hypothetical protein